MVKRHAEYEELWASADFRAALRGEQSLEEYVTEYMGGGEFEGMSVPQIVADMIALGTNVHGVNQVLVRKLRHLSCESHAICLATDQVLFRLQYLRKHLPDLFELFEYQFASCDIGAIKEEPAFFESVLDILGASAEDCIFIDDRDANVQCARKQGISSIRYAKERHENFERWLQGQLI